MPTSSAPRSTDLRVFLLSSRPRLLAYPLASILPCSASSPLPRPSSTDPFRCHCPRHHERMCKTTRSDSLVTGGVLPALIPLHVGLSQVPHTHVPTGHSGMLLRDMTNYQDISQARDAQCVNGSQVPVAPTARGGGMRCVSLVVESPYFVFRTDEKPITPSHVFAISILRVNNATAKTGRHLKRPLYIMFS
ncbi:uncharacterized protein B0I36DRAFT_320982 [Microdochium trichocladiopsis]|uniref:Uncharacterized protein n=1 Tax=Microdochium trichocladiopsis TaxID=1682393 RepID=A0A9P8Y6U1_9PEZI|nr:uncharacterized protein B0I36DRAFT_320982 [Microdochium trichocladiopsis]KAH7033210.1 hypothetical protein B0I36DRAFT_320982 [Microdochium trichocladiopsis]